MTPGERACPGGCGHLVPRRLLACRVDWFRLPIVYRQRIRDTYRQIGTAGEGPHLAAVREALAWYCDNMRGV
jgi:hypothetical protein